mgnify:CR=1 FL=1
MGWIYLSIAIIFEVSAALSLKYTVPVAPEEKYNIVPGILMIVFYILCFLFMIQAVKILPLGLMYAIWGGVGTAAIALLSWQIWGEHMPMMKIAGIGLIIMGVFITNLAKTDTNDESTKDGTPQVDGETTSGPTSKAEARPDQKISPV